MNDILRSFHAVNMAEHTVDRDRLHDAINMCAANKLYAWSNPLTEPLKINSIGILHEGEIQFPLEEEVR